MPIYKPGILINEIAENLGFSPTDIILTEANAKGKYLARFKKEPKESAISAEMFFDKLLRQYYDNKILELELNADFNLLKGDMQNSKTHLKRLQAEADKIYIESGLKLLTMPNMPDVTKEQRKTEFLKKLQKENAKSPSSTYLQLIQLEELETKLSREKEKISNIEKNMNKIRDDSKLNLEQIQKNAKLNQVMDNVKHSNQASNENINRQLNSSNSNPIPGAKFPENKIPPASILDEVHHIKALVDKQMGKMSGAEIIGLCEERDLMFFADKIMEDYILSMKDSHELPPELKREAQTQNYHNEISKKLIQFVSEKLGANFRYFTDSRSHYSLYYKPYVLNADQSPETMIQILKRTCDNVKPPKIYFETAKVDDRNFSSNNYKLLEGSAAIQYLITTLSNNKALTLSQATEIFARVKLVNEKLGNDGLHLLEEQFKTGRTEHLKPFTDMETMQIGNFKWGELIKEIGISPEDIILTPGEKEKEYFVRFKSDPPEANLPFLEFSKKQFEKHYYEQVLNLKNDKEYLEILSNLSSIDMALSDQKTEKSKVMLDSLNSQRNYLALERDYIQKNAMAQNTLSYVNNIIRTLQTNSMIEPKETLEEWNQEKVKLSRQMENSQEIKNKISKLKSNLLFVNQTLDEIYIEKGLDIKGKNILEKEKMIQAYHQALNENIANIENPEIKDSLDQLNSEKEELLKDIANHQRRIIEQPLGTLKNQKNKIQFRDTISKSQQSVKDCEENLKKIIGEDQYGSKLTDNPSVELLQTIKNMSTEIYAQIEAASLGKLLVSNADPKTIDATLVAISGDLLVAKNAKGINAKTIESFFTQCVDTTLGLDGKFNQVPPGSKIFSQYYKPYVISAQDTPEDMIEILKNTCDKNKSSPKIFFETSKNDEFRTKKLDDPNDRNRLKNKILEGKPARDRILGVLSKSETLNLSQTAEILLRIEIANPSLGKLGIGIGKRGLALLAQQLEKYTLKINRKFEEIVLVIARLNELKNNIQKGMAVDPQLYDTEFKRSIKKLEEYEALKRDYMNFQTFTIPGSEQNIKSLLNKDRDENIQAIHRKLEQTFEGQNLFLQDYYKPRQKIAAKEAKAKAEVKTEFTTKKIPEPKISHPAQAPPKFITLAANAAVNPSNRGINIKATEKTPLELQNVLRGFIRDKQHLRCLEVNIPNQEPHSVSVVIAKAIPSMQIEDNHIAALYEVVKKAYEEDPSQSFTIKGLEAEKAIALYRSMTEKQPKIENVNFSELVRRNIENTQNPDYLAILKNLDEKRSISPNKPRSGLS